MLVDGTTAMLGRPLTIRKTCHHRLMSQLACPGGPAGLGAPAGPVSPDC